MGPGTRLTAARRLRIGTGFVVGANAWYLAANGTGRVILEVRNGVVQEVGIADPALTGSRRAAHRFLTSFY